MLLEKKPKQLDDCSETLGSTDYCHWRMTWEWEKKREGHLTYKQAPHVSRSISTFLSSSACRVANTAMQKYLRGLINGFVKLEGLNLG